MLKKSAWLHLPHAIAMGLHVRNINVVTLTPETAGVVSVWAVAYHCRYQFPQGAHYHHVNVIYLLP